jgi:NSS family neurotransmitter:Na+ symporter
VGLGNVWRLPYMAGTNGGSAFVLVYLICVVFIGLPIMIAEILIGRRARQNPISALQTLTKESHHSQKWGRIRLVGRFGAADGAVLL